MDHELRNLHQGYHAEQRRLVPEAEPEPPRAEHPPAPRLSCEGRAGDRHASVRMSLARGSPLVLECPRCGSRFRIEEVNDG